MIKTLKITALIMLAQCASIMSLAQASNTDSDNGIVYVHTSRNSPKITIEKIQDKLKTDTILPAKDLEIGCDENQIAFLILSNRTVLEIGNNTKIKIKSFIQAQPFSFDYYDENERTRSTLDVEILQGNIRVFGSRPRATSSINITTPYGKFDVKSTKFTMSISEKNANIIIFEGQSTFISKNGKRDFIQNKQRGEISVEKLNSKYPMIIEYLTSIEEDALWLKYEPCKTVYNSVEFYQTKDKKINAVRITPKEFLNRSAKYEYRK